MRRREFLAALVSAAAWPLVPRAQQADRMRRVGILMPLTVDDPYDQARPAFLQGLPETVRGLSHEIDKRT
jgi:putative ABC transport system substrate-binding protein